MSIMKGIDAASLLIEALGLRRQRVYKITIEAGVDGLARCCVHHYLTDEQMDAVHDTLLRHRARCETLPITVDEEDTPHA